MKISIGMKLQSGPYGGGNQFGKALTNQLRDFGHQVIFDLYAPDIDLILLTDPRAQMKACAYSHREILTYLKEVNSESIVIHRINECDERKDSTGLNSLLRNANKVADHTVFISAWLRDLHLSQGMEAHQNTVIFNGPDPHIFNPNGYKKWTGSGPIKLVTHHWAGNWNKGFEIYQKIDELIATKWNGIFEFTYVGNLPEGFSFKNARYHKPLSGKQLADTLKENHVYITGSINEPGGSHQSEGALCGLPVLYLNSGCLPEYCRGYGIEFTNDSFERRVESIARSYDTLVNKVSSFPFNSNAMREHYIALFKSLLENKDNILQSRAELPIFESEKQFNFPVAKIAGRVLKSFIR